MKTSLVSPCGLLVCVMLLSSAVASTQETTSDSASHHLQSGLGFTYDVPQDLTILSASQMASDLREAENRQGEFTQGETKSIECGKGLLLAETHDETKIMALTVHYQECIGAYSLTAKNLPQIGSSAVVELNKLFVLSDTVIASPLIGKHPTWVMQCHITPKNPRNPNKYMAAMIVPVSQGLAEFVLQAKTDAGLRELMASRIKFDDGAEGEIIPLTAFSQQP